MGSKICWAVILPSVFPITPLASGEDARIPSEQYLRESAVASKVIERLLDDEAANWARSWQEYRARVRWHHRLAPSRPGSLERR